MDTPEEFENMAAEHRRAAVNASPLALADTSGTPQLADTRAIIDDARWPAVLLYRGRTADCATLGQAIAAFYALPEAIRISATIQMIGGSVFTAEQIDLLHQQSANGGCDRR